MAIGFLQELEQSLGQPKKPSAVPESEIQQASRGERNNNPGNLEASDWTKSQPGYKGSDGRFAIFETAEHGRRAQERLLREGRKYRGKSVVGILESYAPRSDNRASFNNYVGYVAARAGIDPTQPVPSEKVSAVAAAMREFETGKTQKIQFKPYGGNMAGGGSAGMGVINNGDFLAGLESVLGPETASSQNVTQNAATIFGSDAEMAKRGQAVEGVLNQQGQAIDVLDQVMQAAHAVQVQAMTQQVEDTSAISREIVDGVTELKNKVKPIFEARGRIADQLDKLNTMNPLERGIRGIFDLNYSAKYLEGQLDNFDRTLQARAADFDYLGKLHSTALGEIERRYNLDTALPNLAVKQAEEDLGIVGMRLTQTAGLLGNLKDQISGESMLIQAKAQARGDMMNRLDTPTLIDLMTKANQNGGIIQYNGVEFSHKELRDQIQTNEQRNLQIEAYKMSIANQRMDIADKYATNIARSLGKEQLEEAIANGGNYNGVQIPMDVLTSLYQTAIAQGELQAQQITSQLPASLALSTATDALNFATGLQNRATAVFGPKATAGSATYLNRGADLIRKLVQATQTPGTPSEVITALTQQIQKNSQEFQAHIDSVTLRAVGNDKKAAGFMQSFLMGTPMGQGSSVEAITYFALKGNLPAGIQMNPEARQIFAKAQQLVEQHRVNPNTQKARTEAELQTIVTRELTQAASQMVGVARFKRLWDDLPSVAKKTGHPLGKIDSQQWQQMLKSAEFDAAKAVARAINTGHDNVLRMYRTGKPLGDTQEDKELFALFEKASGTFNAVEQMSLAESLDSLPQATTGRRNSSVLADFLGSPQMMGAAETYTKAVGQNSFADYLVNPLAAGALESNIVSTREDLLTTQSSISAARRQAAREQPYGMMTQPVARATVILSSIDGIGSEGAQALAPTIRNIVEEFRGGQGWAKGLPKASQLPAGQQLSPNAIMVHEDNVIYNRLASIKFQDPRLETYRKLAVKGWQDNATRTMGTLERIAEAAHAVIDSNSPF